MKKIAILAAIIIASFLMVIPLAGCEGETSFTTASLSEATMCQFVDTNNHPIGATVSFHPLVPEIWCSVKVSHAPPDTKVKAQWIYISGESTHLHNFLFYEVVATIEGTQYIGFQCPLTEARWPTGRYKVVLYIDSEKELSLPFTVF